MLSFCNFYLQWIRCPLVSFSPFFLSQTITVKYFLRNSAVCRCLISVIDMRTSQCWIFIFWCSSSYQKCHKWEPIACVFFFFFFNVDKFLTDFFLTSSILAYPATVVFEVSCENKTQAKNPTTVHLYFLVISGWVIKLCKTELVASVFCTFPEYVLWFWWWGMDIFFH